MQKSSSKAAILFKAFDLDGKGYLDRKNAHAALTELGLMHGMTNTEMGECTAYAHVAHAHMHAQEHGMFTEPSGLWQPLRLQRWRPCTDSLHP